jgi:type II secretory pathway pseudopilin PulG
MKAKSAMREARPRQGGWSLLETLLALVLVGLGLFVWSRVQGASWGQSRDNARMQQAGQLIEKHIEAMRVGFAQNPGVHWPPRDTSFTSGDLNLVRRVNPASSPKDGQNLPNVRRVDISVAWGRTSLDSINISTYVTLKF